MPLFLSGKGVNLLKGLELFSVRPSQSKSNCTKSLPDVQRVCHKVEKIFPRVLRKEADLPIQVRIGGSKDVCSWRSGDILAHLTG